MTNREAIERLILIFERCCNRCDAEALDLAIEALEGKPKGEWIFDSAFTAFGNPYGTYRCSCCGGHSSNRYSFCKDCGADMREEKKNGGKV